MAQAVIGPVSRWHDSGIVGVGPGLWYGPTALDGAAGDWKRAPLGSIYVRVDASGTATGTWQKIAKAGATADWKKLTVNDAGTLSVTTASTDAVPVLTLRQTDVSEEFIRFVGTSTTDNSQSLVDAANLATPGAIAGWIKIYVQDDQGTSPITDGVYYMPFYATPTA